MLRLTAAVCALTLLVLSVASHAVGAGILPSFPADTHKVAHASSLPEASAKSSAPDLLAGEDTIYDRRGFWLQDWSRGKVKLIARAPRSRPSVLVPILMYHHVRPIDFKSSNAFVSSLTLPPAEFERQMAYLKGRGFTPVTLSRFGQYLRGEVDLPAKTVVLTFDDGYQDNYQYALPILKSYGFSGTFFIITGLVGEPDYVTWDQVVEMANSGMEIGSHTINHPDLAKSLPVLRDRELVLSKKRLEDAIGKRVTSLSYPSGAYNADTVVAARAAGYEVAVTTRYASTQYGTQPLELTRVRVQGTDTLPVFRWRIEQYFPMEPRAR